MLLSCDVKVGPVDAERFAAICSRCNSANARFGYVCVLVWVTNGDCGEEMRDAIFHRHRHSVWDLRGREGQFR